MLTEMTSIDPCNLSQEQQAACDRVLENLIDGVDPTTADMEQAGLIDWHIEHDSAKVFCDWRAVEAGRRWAVDGPVPERETLADALRRRWRFVYGERCKAAEQLPTLTAVAAELQERIKTLVHHPWGDTKLSELETVNDLIRAFRRATAPIGPDDEAVAPLNAELRRVNSELQHHRQTLAESRSWVLLHHAEKLERLQAAAVDAGDDRRAAEIGEELEQASAMLAEPASFSLYVKPQPALASSSSTPRG